MNSNQIDYTGGETIFPLFEPGKHQAAWKNVNNCSRNVLAVRPQAGDAVLFYSLLPDGTEDPGSTHGSCDVISGIKYSGPVWSRQRPFHPESLKPSGPPPCENKVAACNDWEVAGECTANPEYMLENCRKACTKC